MTLTSILGLLLLPLLKRPELASKKLPEFLDPRIIENAALKGRVAELEAKLDDLSGKLADANRDVALGQRARSELRRENEHLRRDRDYWASMMLHQRAAQTDYSALLGFQAHADRQVAQSNQGLAQQAQAQAQQMPGEQYIQALGQPVNPFHQAQAWHDCTCVPGRAAAFGVLRTPGDGS